MLSQFSVIVKKLAIPVLFFAAGVFLIILGITQKQDFMFNISAVMMLLAGLLSLLFSLGKLNSKVVMIVGFISLPIAAVLYALSWKSVGDTTRYQINYENTSRLAVQNLQDIRYVQKIHMDQHGKYLGTWEEFNDFVRNGRMPYVDSRGTVPAEKITEEERNYLYHDNRPIDVNMTEEEAYRLSKWKEGPRYNDLFTDFKRDTLMLSILDLKFKSRSYVDSRKKNGFHRFSVDSLQYIPYTGARNKWDLKTKDSVKVQDSYIPTIRVEGKIPFHKTKGKKDESNKFYFGNLNTSDVSGSWEAL